MSIYIDLILIILLIASNAYIFIFVRNLKAVQQSKAELKKVVQELNFTISKAENAVHGLQENAQNKGREIQKEIDKGERLLEELQYIHQAGDNVAQRLERLVNKKTNASNASHDKMQAHKESAEEDNMSQAEKDLSKAMRDKKVKGNK